MLPEMFAEQHIRVYFRKNDPASLDKAKRLVDCARVTSNEYLACVATVPVRAKCYVSRASEDPIFV